MTADRPTEPRPAQDETRPSGRMTEDDPPDQSDDCTEKTDGHRHRFRDWALI